AGLLALAGVLGVGEGHLLHRKALRVKSADFAKSGSLFQSFLHQEKGERLAVWQLISLRECFYQHRHFQEVSFSPRCSFLGITLALSRGEAVGCSLWLAVRYF